MNRYLLDEVSYVGRGTAEYLRPREDAKELVDRFYERIGKPYLTDIQLDWGGLPVGEVVPARMRDLSAFSPAIVLARYTAGGRGALTLRGKIGGRPFEQRIELTLPDRQVEH